MRLLDQPYHLRSFIRPSACTTSFCGVPLAGFAASFRIAGVARARRCLVAVRIRRLTGAWAEAPGFS
jgi:hypothetical protein